MPDNKKKFRKARAHLRQANARLARIAEIIEQGDQRLLATDGPIMPNDVPDLTVDEFREIYELALDRTDPFGESGIQDIDTAFKEWFFSQEWPQMNCDLEAGKIIAHSAFIAGHQCRAASEKEGESNA
jgi:hypothetical protein